VIVIDVTISIIIDLVVGDFGGIAIDADGKIRRNCKVAVSNDVQRAFALNLEFAPDTICLQ